MDALGNMVQKDVQVEEILRDEQFEEEASIDKGSASDTNGEDFIVQEDD